ncbi:MAG: hypothetical protein II702_08585 [Clostridia bacterium]|nr:hypothetical protein [Clostridia bacterium]
MAKSKGNKNKNAAGKADVKAKKTSVKNDAPSKGSGPKKIIIPTVALILVAALLVTGYFVWYKPKHAGGPEPVTNTTGGGSDTKQSVDFKKNKYTYETADYNGYTVPAFVAEMLKGADKDSEAACKKYGTALTVAGHDVSTSEFGMMYFDMFIDARDSLIDDPNGLTPVTNTAPAEQKYGDTEYTWADRLKEVTAEKIKKNYILFYEALENGFMPTDSCVADMEEAKNSAEYFSGIKNVTADEDMAETYCEGATLNLFMRNYILKSYAADYEAAVREMLASKRGKAEMDEVYKANPEKYNYVDVRVFVINKQTMDAVEKAKKEVKDLESFYQFGIDYYSAMFSDYSDYKEEATRFFCLRKSELSGKFGDAIGEWCFEDGRKPGDIEVVEGTLFYCLLYMVKPQYMIETVDFYQCLSYFNDDMDYPRSDEEKENTYNYLKTPFETLKSSDNKTETFKEIDSQYDENALSYENEGMMKRTGVKGLEYNALEWLYSSERKKGDCELIYIRSAYAIIMFDHINKGDYNYYLTITDEYSDSDFGSFYESLKNYNGNEITEYSEGISKGAQYGETASAAYAAKVAKNSQSSQTTQTAQ